MLRRLVQFASVSSIEFVIGIMRLSAGAEARSRLAATGASSGSARQSGASARSSTPACAKCRRSDEIVRILQILKHFGWGGTPRMLELLAREWTADGHDVLNWLPSPQRIPANLPVWTGDTFPFMVLKADVTVVHGGIIGAADLGIGPGVALSPVVEVIHRLLPARPGASAYVAVSDSVAAMQEFPCTVIPNAVALNEPVVTRAATRAMLGFTADAVVVARHNRMVMEKGWHTTLRVLERAWAQDSRIVGLLIGADDQGVSRLIRTWAQDKPCAVQDWHDDPAYLLHAADIYLETCPREAWGLAAAEAALAGLPIVAHATPERSEVLGEHFLGLPDVDVETAAARVLELAADPFARREIGARLRGRIRSHYPPRLCARRYIDLFEKLLTTAGLVDGN